MIKKLILSSLLVVSVIGVMPTVASAVWKQDKYKNYSWVENGVKAKGWKQINGDWYNFGKDGVMVTQWMMDNGNWYYFWTNGMMASNCWIKNNGFWYYFDGSGKMIDKKIDIGDKMYDFTAPAIIVSKDANGKEAATNSTTNDNINGIGKNTDITVSSGATASK